MTELVFRPAMASEVERVRTAYAEWGYCGGILPGDEILIAEEDGRLVGLVRRLVEHGTTMLRGMQVAPDARGRGVGSRLLDAFVDRIDGLECYCIPFAHLVHFYGRQGFRVELEDVTPAFLADRARAYRAKGLDVVVMRRPASSEIEGRSRD